MYRTRLLLHPKDVPVTQLVAPCNRQVCRRTSGPSVGVKLSGMSTGDRARTKTIPRNVAVQRAVSEPEPLSDGGGWLLRHPAYGIVDENFIHGQVVSYADETVTMAT
ncbi:hypothetical protein ON010_g9404 [Phytophthora cinnamomi]|nr:hypothetical protein ON010_g9404 [Phytophthora cinnamomi]